MGGYGNWGTDKFNHKGNKPTAEVSRVMGLFPGLLRRQIIGGERNDFLHASGKHPPGKQDTPIAGQAFQADISTQSDNAPFIASTRMGFAQAHDVPQVQLW